MHPTITAVFTGIVCAALLAACGGGGGGGTDMPATQLAPGPAPAPAPERAPGVAEESRALAPPVEEVVRVYARATQLEAAPTTHTPGPPAPTTHTPGPPAQALPTAAREAAVAEPQRGSLHLSSVPRGVAPVVVGGFTMEPAHHTYKDACCPPFVQTHHYFDETYLVDYDGDGEPERRLTVAEDSWVEPRVAERGICHVADGKSGQCSGWVGSPDRYMLAVYRMWTAAGLLHPAQPRFEVTRGWWHDRETGHVGVFWSGPSVDDPRPLEQPIHGSALTVAGGHAFLPNGELVQASALGLLTFDVQDASVRLELGMREQPHHAGGITVVGLDRLEEYGYPVVDRIEQVFVYKETYHPDSPYFGIGEGQLNRGNDVVSGNGRGQFGGVITTTPDMIANPHFSGAGAFYREIPTVFGVVGLTDVEGYDGLSLLMSLDAQMPQVMPGGVNPDISGTWRGDMSGSRVGGPTTLSGNSEITYHLADATVDVRVTDIEDRETGQGYAALAWEGVSVRGGSFQSTTTTWRGQPSVNTVDMVGGFYGAGQEEVSGDFTHWYNASVGIEGSFHGAFGGARAMFDPNPSANTNPPITATWRGAMAGQTVAGVAVNGGAEIVYRNSHALGTDELDVHLTPQGHDPLVWKGLGVVNGAFGDDVTIMGSFSGPGHEEVGGRFDRSGLSGTFDARRE